VSARAAAKEVTLLDYGAGNVRSVRNAIKKLGYTIKDVSSLLHENGGSSSSDDKYYGIDYHRGISL
jgi:hypothetical protein